MVYEYWYPKWGRSRRVRRTILSRASPSLSTVRWRPRSFTSWSRAPATSTPRHSTFGTDSSRRCLCERGGQPSSERSVLGCIDFDRSDQRLILTPPKRSTKYIKIHIVRTVVVNNMKSLIIS